MGRQIRKVSPWVGMYEAHLHSNHVIHRLYRWTSYHSHPTMRPGHPFKSRGAGRPFPGTLLTPDSIKFKIPIMLAFVPINEKYNPRTSNNPIERKCCGGSTNRSQLLSASDFKFNGSCQKTVMNYNSCVKNNRDNLDNCFYYVNYLNNSCRLGK